MLTDLFNVDVRVSWVRFVYVVAQNDFQYGFRSTILLIQCIYTGNSESLFENYGLFCLAFFFKHRG